jgi:hypothetical protein
MVFNITEQIKCYEFTSKFLHSKNTMVSQSHSKFGQSEFYYPVSIIGVSDVMQKDIRVHTAEPLVPQPSPFEFDTAIGKTVKGTNCQVLIKFHQQVKHYVPRSINS